MNRICYSLFFAAAILLTACNGNNQRRPQPDNITEQEAEQPQTFAEADAKNAIREFYATYVLGSAPLDDTTARRFCTLALCNRLRSAYAHEYSDGAPGYALWLLRTGAQDGPSHDSRVVDIVNSGIDAYEVMYLDMGIRGRSLVTIAVEDGTPKMDSVKRLEPAE